MAFFIEAVSGSNEGKRYKIGVGTTLGRSRSDIIIKDPKVSSVHAEVGINAQNQLVLNDLESSNGLYINGRRVKKVTLLPGVMFEVGRTLFQVIEVADAVAEEVSHVVTWRGTLAQALTDFPPDEGKSTTLIRAFSPALKLVFIQGIQSEQEFFLGYGPRKAGSQSLDIELLDARAPEQAFELLPGPGMVQFKSLSPKVLLNGQAVKNEMLKEGYLISVGETLIRASYY